MSPRCLMCISSREELYQILSSGSYYILLHDIYVTALIASTPEGIMEKSMAASEYIIEATPNDEIKAKCNNCNKGFKSMCALCI